MKIVIRTILIEIQSGYKKFFRRTRKDATWKAGLKISIYNPQLPAGLVTNTLASSAVLGLTAGENSVELLSFKSFYNSTVTQLCKAKVSSWIDAAQMLAVLN